MDGNLNKDLDENLAWLTQKTEELESNKESGNPPISASTPPFQVYPRFLGKNVVPPK